MYIGFFIIGWNNIGENGAKVIGDCGGWMELRVLGLKKNYIGDIGLMLLGGQTTNSIHNMEYYKNQCKKGFPNLNHLDLSTPYLITQPTTT